MLELYPAAADDTFNLVMRNATTGAYIDDQQSVFRLTFTDGYSGWRPLTLSLNAGDVLEVTAHVANVGDAARPSGVWIDRISEGGLMVSSLELDDQRQTLAVNAGFDPLEYVSASSHDADPNDTYTGYTTINGRLEISGPGAAAAGSILLEVLENGVVRASAPLAPAATVTTLPNGTRRYESFGAPHSPLFALNSADLADINQTTNGALKLRVTVTTFGGRLYRRFLDRDVTKLIWVPPTTPRTHAERELGNCIGYAFFCGGDSWTRPSTSQFAAALAAQTEVAYDDFSNMNGSYFPPHERNKEPRGHFAGTGSDGKWRGAAWGITRDTAVRLKRMFAQPTAANIDYVWLTFGPENIQFWAEATSSNANGPALIDHDAAVAYEADNDRSLVMTRGKLRWASDHRSHYHIQWKVLQQ